MTKKNGLSTLQEAFCHEYLVDLNPQNAVVRAGYSEYGRIRTGKNLIKDPRIRARIEQLQAQRLAKVDVQSQEVLYELLQIVRVDITQAFNPDGSMRRLDDIPVDVRRTISGLDIEDLFEGQGKNREHVGYTKKIRFLDKLKALELLGKHLGLFKDVVEHRLEGEIAELMIEARERRSALAEERATREVEVEVIETSEPEKPKKPPLPPPSPTRPEGHLKAVDIEVTVQGCPRCYTEYKGDKCPHCGLKKVRT